jgi:integrase
VTPIEGTLTLWQPKNGHARTIPILDCIRPIIETRMTIEGSQHLFPEGSNPWLRNAWEKARELMGKTDDPQFVPHMLRHTCATRLSQSGVSLPVIKEWLGHTTIQTTIRYAHFNKKDLLSAAQALSK